MINNRLSRPRWALAAAALGCLLLPAGARAQSALYWDVNGTAAGSGVINGTNDTWDATSKWNTDSAGGNGTIQAWSDNNFAIFYAGVDATGSYTNALSDTKTVAGITFSSGTTTLTGGGLDLAGSLVAVKSGAKAIIASPITGSVGLTKTNSGELVLSGVNTFTGDLTVNGGTLTLDNGSAASGGNIVFNSPASKAVLSSSQPATTIANAVNLGANNSAILEIDAASTNTLTLSGVLSGAHNWQANGPGTLRLAGANTFSGALTVQQGTLVAASPGALGSANGVTVNSGAALALDGGVSCSLDPSVSLSLRDGGTTGALISLSGNNRFNGVIMLASDSTIGVTAGSTLTLPRAVDGGGNLTKVGNGTLYLSAPGNSYNGTVVSAGTLEVDYPANAGTGLVTVSNNATLTGSGYAMGGVNLSGTLAPSSIFNSGAQTWNGGAKVMWAVASTNDTSLFNDLIAISGPLAINVTTQKVTVAVASLDANTFLPGALANFDNTKTYAWTVATSTGITGFNPANFATDASQFTNSLGGGRFLVDTNNNNLIVRFDPAPALSCTNITKNTDSGKNYATVTLVVKSVTDNGTVGVTFFTNGVMAAASNGASAQLLAGVNTVTAIATDNVGNTTTNTFTVTVTDNQAPTIVSKPAGTNAVLGSTSPAQAPVPDVTGLVRAVAWDNVTASNLLVITQNPTAGTMHTGPGNSPIAVTVTDLTGNFITTNVDCTYLDQTMPTMVSKPGVVTLQLNGSVQVTPNDVDAGTTDNVGIAGRSVISATSPQTNIFYCSDLGNHVMIFTAWDAAGNSNFTYVTVTVQNTNPPSVSSNAITVKLDASGNYNLSWADRVALVAGSLPGACGSFTTTNFTRTSFTTADVGNPASVGVTMTDIYGRSGSATSTVIVVASNATPSVVYVDPSYTNSGALVTFAGSPSSVHYLVGYEAFSTIQAGVNAVVADGTGIVNVDPGTYAENVRVSKALTLVGPNAGKAGSSGSRGAEAHVIPAVADPQNLPVISVEADNVVINGLLIDGNNPALGDSIYHANGVPVHAAAAIQNGAYTNLVTINGLQVQNNILTNASYDGIFVEVPKDSINGGNYILNNKFANMWEGLLTYGWNSVISNNVFSSVNHGLSIHATLVAAANGFTPMVVSNTLTIGQWWPNAAENDVTVAPGIWVNWRQDGASTLTVQGNTINVPTAAPSGKSIVGLYALNILDLAQVNFIGNVVTNATIGAQVYSCPNAGAVTIQGGSLKNIGSVGVLADTVGAWSTNDAKVTVNNVLITTTNMGVFANQETNAPGKFAVVNVIGGTSISGGGIGIEVQGTNASVIAKNSSVINNAKGVEVNAGQATLENVTLTGNTTGINAVNHAVVNAGDCGGNSNGTNDLSGYYGRAGAVAISSTSSTVTAYNNKFGVAPNTNITAVISGTGIVWSQYGGLLVVAPNDQSIDCIRAATIPAPITNWAGFMASSANSSNGVASASDGTITSVQDVTNSTATVVTRTYTLTDHCGVQNTAVQKFTAKPADFVLVGPSTVTFQYNDTYSDLGVSNRLTSCAAYVVVTNGLPHLTAGKVDTLGSNYVTYIATNMAGFGTTNSRTVYVVDTVGPQISIYTNGVLVTGSIVVPVIPGTNNATVSYTLTATDNYDGVLNPTNITVTPASGSLFSLGNNTVTASVKDAHGNQTTTNFTVVVTDKAVITSQPSGLTLNAGASATFTVAATSAGPLSYQWQKNGSAISGKTSTTLSLSNITTNDAATYSVVVSTAAGSVTSSNAVLTVIDTAVVSNVANNVTNNAGTTASLSLNVTGTTNATGAPYTIQWFKGTNLLSAGNKYAGVTNTTLFITNVFGADAGNFTATVGNPSGTVTNTPAIKLAVVDPYISQQPLSQTNGLGNSTSFSVGVVGTQPVSYQWSQDGVVLAGATNSTYAISQVSASDAGVFTVVISNIYGTVTSAKATNTVLRPPVIVSQPANTAVAVGQLASFNVGANGTSPFTYQWQKNGVSISGATNSYFSISSVATSDAGTFSVLVTNRDGFASSAGAVLTVITTPVVITGPQTQVLNAGLTGVFTVTNSGGGSSYQWVKNNTNLLSDGSKFSGTSSDTLSISNLVKADEGFYSVIISNVAGQITSSVAGLSVNDPAINTQPADVAALINHSATLSVGAGGTALTYQWYKNTGTGAVAIASGTNASYTIASVTTNDVASYWVTVTNGFGALVSSNAQLVIMTAPVITSQPANVQVATNGTATFTVGASGMGTLQYQWYKGATALSNGGRIAGADTATLTINNCTSADVATYSVVVNNQVASVTSTGAQLSFASTVAQILTLSSTNLNVIATSNAVFTVTFSGTAPTVQWVQNGTNVLSAGPNIGIFTGATNGTLWITNALAANRGSYTAVVTNALGGGSTNFTLSVADPFIVQQPKSSTNGVGSTATFSVAALGTAPLQYQWSFVGVPIPGETNASLVLDNVTANDGGAYNVVVTSVGGSVTSSNVTLTTYPALISTQPQSQVAFVGQTITLSVSSDSAGVTFQWYKNGSILTGQTTRFLTLGPLTLADAGAYTVLVTGQYASLLSQPANITVSGVPVLSLVRSNNASLISVRWNGNGQVAIQYSDTPTGGWQWLRNPDGTFVLNTPPFTAVDTNTVSKRFYRGYAP